MGVKLESKEEFLKLIYLINKHYGPEQAKKLEVSLKLKQKLPSSNFKTKKDFLEQLRKTLLKTPPKTIRPRTPRTPRTVRTQKTTPRKQIPQRFQQTIRTSQPKTSMTPQQIFKPEMTGEQIFEEGMVEMKKKKLKELLKLENHMAELKKQKLNDLIEIENHKLWV